MTGILVYYLQEVSSQNITIGWRTDIDGLPIVEQTGLLLPLSTQTACMLGGRDFHMTIALKSRTCSRKPTQNNLLFALPACRENEAIGMLMYEDGDCWRLVA